MIRSNRDGWYGATCSDFSFCFAAMCSARDSCADATGGAVMFSNTATVAHRRTRIGSGSAGMLMRRGGTCKNGHSARNPTAGSTRVALRTAGSTAAKQRETERRETEQVPSGVKRSIQTEPGVDPNHRLCEADSENGPC